MLSLDARGVITRVERGAARTEGSVTPSGAASGAGVEELGVVVPGVANLHSHAFQRGLAGLAERRGATGRDSFWRWRRVMYAFVARLSPDEVETLAALAYCEMLEAGFTSVGEFHYLHHGPDGRPYDDPGEMAGRICAAAGEVGIALTLLPVFYRHGDVGGVAAGPGQQRFVTRVEGFAELMERAGRHAASLPHARLGVAPHSLRAVDVGEIAEILPLARGGPVHMHVAEQEAEVDRCVDVLGARPVEHLLDTLPVDGRWCLVHCTHMEPGEVARLAARGAVAGFCPSTEANLGDGVPPAGALVAAGGRYGVGTDSHVRIDLAEELRLLEYGQRMVHRRRTVLAAPGRSTGRTLVEEAASGGGRALDQPGGAIAPGARADLVVLDDDDPRLMGRRGDALLDAWVFGGGATQVREVWVGGRRVVVDGRAVARDAVDARWRRLAPRLAGWPGASGEAR